MNRIFSIISVVIISVFMSAAGHHAMAANTLFEYPVAPDTCTTLESRCNYIVVNFWNNYDITRPIADDVAFEGAFRDYINFFKYAHRNIVISSMRNFIFRARSNAANLSKVGQIAESALYGPKAEYWSDELYCEIAKTLSESSNLKAPERNHYKRQIEIINKCAIDAIFPDLEIVTADGKKKLSSIDCEVYLLLFTDGSVDSSIERTRLCTDVGVENLIDSGQIKVVQIYAGKPGSDWLSAQPEKWVNGYSDQVSSSIDLRAMPSCYVLDKDRKILNKNLTVETIKNSLN